MAEMEIVRALGNEKFEFIDKDSRCCSYRTKKEGKKSCIFRMSHLWLPTLTETVANRGQV